MRRKKQGLKCGGIDKPSREILEPRTRGLGACCSLPVSPSLPTVSASGTYHRGEQGIVREKRSVFRKDKELYDNTVGRGKREHKKISGRRGRERVVTVHGGNQENKVRGGVDRYRELRQIGPRSRNGVRAKDTERVHGDHAPLKRASKFPSRYRVGFRR